jgi:hypothetical protein|tara:strand:+ start:480 stop:626 length:147 start_codon:yes stop_codon:yes gene_type:complete
MSKTNKKGAGSQGEQASIKQLEQLFKAWGQDYKKMYDKQKKGGNNGGL